MATKDFQNEIKQALHDDEYMEKLIKYISPEKTKHTDREIGEKVLISISEKHPKRLYDKWDVFVEYLRSDNAFSKYPSLYIIANLVKIDSTKHSADHKELIKSYIIEAFMRYLSQSSLNQKQSHSSKSR